MKKKRNLNMYKVLIVLASCLLTAGLAQPETLITLELTGGAHAGRHQAQDHSTCIYGLGENDDNWEVSYYFFLDQPTGNTPDTLGTLNLTVDSVKDNSAFVFWTALGEEYEGEHYAEYFIDPANSNGTGTVTIERKGKHALVTVTGETADGVGITATIECLDEMNLSREEFKVSTVKFSFPENVTAPTGSLELTVGGQNYSVQTGEEAACTQHVTEDGDLWYEYDPGGSYTGVNIIVQNLEEAKGGTSNFGFGIDSQAVHSYGDDGNLTAVQEGNVVTLELKATSADGIAMSAIAKCSVQ